METKEADYLLDQARSYGIGLNLSEEEHCNFKVLIELAERQKRNYQWRDLKETFKRIDQLRQVYFLRQSQQTDLFNNSIPSMTA